VRATGSKTSRKDKINKSRKLNFINFINDLLAKKTMLHKRQQLYCTVVHKSVNKWLKCIHSKL